MFKDITKCSYVIEVFTQKVYEEPTSRGARIYILLDSQGALEDLSQTSVIINSPEIAKKPKVTIREKSCNIGLAIRLHGVTQHKKVDNIDTRHGYNTHQRFEK